MKIRGYALLNVSQVAWPTRRSENVPSWSWQPKALVSETKGVRGQVGRRGREGRVRDRGREDREGRRTGGSRGGK